MRSLSRKVEDYPTTVDELNTFLNNILLSRLSGQIIESIELPIGGAEVAVSHNLKSVPKYFIILRQSASAVIIDGNTAWDDKKIFLKAVTGSGKVRITILVMRG